MLESSASIRNNFESIYTVVVLCGIAFPSIIPTKYHEKTSKPIHTTPAKAEKERDKKKKKKNKNTFITSERSTRTHISEVRDINTHE